LATRVKHELRIKNPKCVAYDMLFGCPGWLEGVIQATAFIKAGMAKKCLVIGAETLSRVVDPHDRDSMIYSDGAGATIIEATDR
jgi:3-oxoacyl-[acyl-carrier-protein] synthase-3